MNFRVVFLFIFQKSLLRELLHEIQIYISDKNCYFDLQ
jgi:hypothetical protein